MELDLADVKPSVISWLVVGLLSVSFIVFAKWLFNRYPVKGVTEFFNAV